MDIDEDEDEFVDMIIVRMTVWLLICVGIIGLNLLCLQKTHGVDYTHITKCKNKTTICKCVETTIYKVKMQ